MSNNGISEKYVKQWRNFSNLTYLVGEIINVCFIIANYFYLNLIAVIYEKKRLLATDKKLFFSNTLSFKGYFSKIWKIKKIFKIYFLLGLKILLII